MMKIEWSRAYRRIKKTGLVTPKSSAFGVHHFNQKVRRNRVIPRRGKRHTGPHPGAPDQARK